jgi:hypothetical protein
VPYLVVGKLFVVDAEFFWLPPPPPILVVCAPAYFGCLWKNE